MKLSHIPICTLIGQGCPSGAVYLYKKTVYVEGGRGDAFQRQKNPVGVSALLIGEFLSVRKVFARVYKIGPETSKMTQVWKDSRQSGKFLDSVESLQTVLKVSGQSGKFSDSLVFFGELSDSLEQITHFCIL